VYGSADVTEGTTRDSWTYLVLGVLSIALGTVGIFYAGLVTITSVLVFGAALVIGGLAQLFHAIRTRDVLSVPVHVPLGILEVVVGGVMLLHPIVTVLGLTLLLAAFFVASGLFRIVLAASVKFPAWGWSVASGLVSVLLGVLVFAEWPASSLWLLGLYVSVYLIVTGWAFCMFWALTRARPLPGPAIP